MKIFKYPAEVLKTKSLPVDLNGSDRIVLPSVITEMRQTMLDNNGLGLAAPQVGISKRFFIIQTPETEEFFVFINPEIELIGENIESEEGCLSLPGITASIERSDLIQISYYDINFEKQNMEVDGLLAIAIQHENDHLDGLLYIDHLEEKERTELLKEYQIKKDQIGI